MIRFQKGQRWINESEPELGVGIVVDVAPGRVFLLFRVSGLLRQYAVDSAPIKRVEFRGGDTIRTHEGESLLVESVTTDAAGLLVYGAAGRSIPEVDLADTLSFSKPEDRLLAGQTDENAAFGLRLEALRRRHQIRHSPVRGLLGARMELIPHQLYVAGEVAARARPRVLLADEVGLGKTIEACLVLHRLHRSGRARRILILVPEPLVHQWFVELLRRFNLLVSIFDEERCLAIVGGDATANPFLDDQVILAPLGLLAGNELRGRQAVAAGWDLLVVDEAHHLEWTPDFVSPEYAIVEALAAACPGVLLLTATPEQLGADGHFARLRLLDAERYGDFARFQAERGDYRETARIAAKLLDAKSLSAVDTKALRRLCRADEVRLEARLAALKAGDPAARSALVSELLDQHGVGRVMFRNTRAVIKGFPKRRVHLVPLAEVADGLAGEWEADHAMEGRRYALKSDPRVDWLVEFLAKMRGAKVLLIARTREKVLALEQALRARVNVKVGFFHEDLTLLQRDRNAAWFAEEDGAQLLLCSEIGSEGRNFQFAHHLVLFDLPENPELLEQRIGRLDRIGQTETIQIHVPYPRGTPLERLARWYHEGLDAFETSLEGAREIIGRLGGRFAKLVVAGGDEAQLSTFLGETRALHEGLRKDLAAGQDRLLQMNSCRPDVAAAIVAQIASNDADRGLDAFASQIFDHYGVQVEELAPRTWLIVPGHLTTEAFPGLPEAGLTLTADRERALRREEIGFLTWDHPMITGAIDLLLGSEAGNSAFAVWEDEGGPAVYLEAVYVIEPVAPHELHADRFLPPTPIRILVDAKGEEVSDELSPPTALFKPGSVFQLLDSRRIKERLLPAMLARSQAHAETRREVVATSAAEKMGILMRGEIERLRDLQRVNDHVRADEIALLETHAEELAARLREAPLRLDSVRLIWRTPSAG